MNDAPGIRTPAEHWALVKLKRQKQQAEREAKKAQSKPWYPGPHEMYRGRALGVPTYDRSRAVDDCDYLSLK
jgi:hypothetical protein